MTYDPFALSNHCIIWFASFVNFILGLVATLDNFSPENIKAIIPKKPQGMTIEVSGGVNLDNIDGYLIEGVDVISIGALTYGAPPVDISFKYKRED